MAVEHNRQLGSARLQVAKAEDQIAIARTRRRPIFSTEATASQLLSPVSFSFPEGSFGTFPATGPIPSTDTTIDVPRQPTMYIQSSVSQPLTQLISDVVYDMKTEKLQRRNQFRTISVSAFPAPGVMSSEVLAAAMPQIEALKASLPVGDRLEVGGEYEEQVKGFKNRRW